MEKSKVLFEESKISSECLNVIKFFFCESGNTFLASITSNLPFINKLIRKVFRQNFLNNFIHFVMARLWGLEV
jgi:hypothetical protein